MVQSTERMKLQIRDLVVVASLVVGVTVVLAQPPMAQDPEYHVMADQRPCGPITNCLNVLSNVPFAIVGLFGLGVTFARGRSGRSRFGESWERWPYAALFTGVTATAIGSSYYHLAPDNARLVWDRLPMALGFMGLLTALVAERITVSLARLLLWPLIGLGAVSVFYWQWTEGQGNGDLRPYFIVQFGSLLVVALLLAFYQSRYTGAVYVLIGLIAYAAAKLFELADQPIWSIGHIVSGHTLKHVTAAGAVGYVAYMLRVRRERSTDPSHARSVSTPLA